VRGSPPKLRPLFNAHDLGDRREWMKLLVLGSLHTLGRTKLEQQREFLRRCDAKGWVKQFVVIFQISRWLPEYVEVLLNVDRLKRPFAIDEIIAPRTSAAFSGSGLDAPALTRGLGMGANFVFRELIRLGVLKQPFAHPHSYVPVRRVCALLDKLATLNIRKLPSKERSSAIYRLLSELIGAERATFGGSFDLPLLALADSPELQEALLGTVLDLEEE
jgi:hypothetical protein